MVVFPLQILKFISLKEKKLTLRLKSYYSQNKY